MELKHLRSFVAVADELSFARAAARLHFATSYVSQQVSQLERELGLRLFERTTRSVRLTPSGAELHRQAAAVLLEVAAFEIVARRHAAGDGSTLVGAFCPGAGPMVAEIVRAVALARPDLTVEFAPMGTPDVAEAVRAGAVAIGICRSAVAELRSLVISENPTAFLALPVGHHLGDRSSVAVTDLEGEKVIIAERGTDAEAHDTLVEFFASRAVHPDFREFHIRSVEEAMELVAARQGVILVDRRTVTHYPVRGTTVCPVEGPVPVTRHMLVWRDGDSSAVKAVIDATDRLRPILQDL